MKIQYINSEFTQESQRLELGSNQAGNGVWIVDVLLQEHYRHQKRLAEVRYAVQMLWTLSNSSGNQSRIQHFRRNSNRTRTGL